MLIEVVGTRLIQVFNSTLKGSAVFLFNSVSDIYIEQCTFTTLGMKFLGSLTNATIINNVFQDMGSIKFPFDEKPRSLYFNPGV